MRIIQDSRHYDVTYYLRIFDFKGEVGWGYSFACDKDGNHLDRPDNLDKFNQACAGKVGDREVVDRGVKTYTQHCHDYAIGLCEHCNTKVELNSFTNTCEHCGADYNMSGQRLADRECWGEETGEHWSECVNPQMED